MTRNIYKTYVPMDILMKKEQGNITYRQLAKIMGFCHVKLYRILTRKYRTTLSVVNRLRHAIIVFVQSKKKTCNYNDLRELKKRTRLSGKWIADQLGVSSRTIWRFFKGQTSLPPQTLRQLNCDLYCLAVGASVQKATR